MYKCNPALSGSVTNHAKTFFRPNQVQFIFRFFVYLPATHTKGKRNLRKWSKKIKMNDEFGANGDICFIISRILLKVLRMASDCQTWTLISYFFCSGCCGLESSAIRRADESRRQRVERQLLAPVQRTLSRSVLPYCDNHIPVVCSCHLIFLKHSLTWNSHQKVSISHPTKHFVHIRQHIESITLRANSPAKMQDYT